MQTFQLNMAVQLMHINDHVFESFFFFWSCKDKT